MVSLECAIWELASLLLFKKNQFSVRDGRVKFKVSDSQNVWRGKACVINSIPKSAVDKNKWALQNFREWQGQRANKICTIEPDGVFIGLHSLNVEELTEGNENKTPKVSTTGYASSCRRLEISRVNDIPLRGFTILSAAYNVSWWRKMARAH